ncbi:hypothetical protein [Streptomyces sp. SD15]
MIAASENAFLTTAAAAAGASHHGKVFQHGSPNFSSQCGTGLAGQICASCWAARSVIGSHPIPPR